jgi:hypothetical protein
MIIDGDKHPARFETAKTVLERREKELAKELESVRAALELLNLKVDLDREAGENAVAEAMKEQSRRWESDKAALSEKKARTVTTIVTPAPDPDRKPN